MRAAVHHVCGVPQARGGSQVFSSMLGSARLGVRVSRPQHRVPNDRPALLKPNCSPPVPAVKAWRCWRWLGSVWWPARFTRGGLRGATPGLSSNTRCAVLLLLGCVAVARFTRGAAVLLLLVLPPPLLLLRLLLLHVLVVLLPLGVELARPNRRCKCIKSAGRLRGQLEEPWPTLSAKGCKKSAGQLRSARPPPDMCRGQRAICQR